MRGSAFAGGRSVAHYMPCTSKPWITTAIADSIKSKNNIYKKYYKEKKNRQRKIYGKQFRTYRNPFTTLLRITKDEYYKTHFKGNKI